MNTLPARWTATWPEDRLQRWAIGSLYAFAFLAPLSISLGQLVQLLGLTFNSDHIWSRHHP